MMVHDLPPSVERPSLATNLLPLLLAWLMVNQSFLKVNNKQQSKEQKDILFSRMKAITSLQKKVCCSVVEVRVVVVHVNSMRNDARFARIC